MQFYTKKNQFIFQADILAKLKIQNHIFFIFNFNLNGKFSLTLEYKIPS